MRKLKLRIVLLIIVCSVFAKNLIAQKQNYVSITHNKEVNVRTENYITVLDVGTVFEINDYFFVGAGINLMKVWSEEYSSLGVGLGPVIQTYVLKRDKLNLYLDSKGALTYLGPEYPETAINYAFFAGLGAEFYVWEKNRIKVGLSYNHLSNAKRKEQVTNPSLDGLGFNVGWVFN